MAEIILDLAFVLIFLGIVFGIIRLVIGPDTVDRVVAVDLLTIIAIAVIAAASVVAMTEPVVLFRRTSRCGSGGCSWLLVVFGSGPMFTLPLTVPLTAA